MHKNKQTNLNNSTCTAVAADIFDAYVTGDPYSDVLILREIHKLGPKPKT